MTGFIPTTDVVECAPPVAARIDQCAG